MKKRYLKKTNLKKPPIISSSCIFEFLSGHECYFPRIVFCIIYKHVFSRIRRFKINWVICSLPGFFEKHFCRNYLFLPVTFNFFIWIFHVNFINIGHLKWK